MPKLKKLTRRRAESRCELLSDRLAVCLMLLKQRHGNDWNPWFGEDCWDQDGGLGDIMRQSNEYPQAREVIELFIHRSERNEVGKD
jgi:hypothetical protein